MKISRFSSRYCYCRQSTCARSSENLKNQIPSLFRWNDCNCVSLVHRFGGRSDCQTPTLFGGFLSPQFSCPFLTGLVEYFTSPYGLRSGPEERFASSVNFRAGKLLVLWNSNSPKVSQLKESIRNYLNLPCVAFTWVTRPFCTHLPIVLLQDFPTSSPAVFSYLSTIPVGQR